MNVKRKRGLFSHNSKKLLFPDSVDGAVEADYHQGLKEIVLYDILLKAGAYLRVQFEVY